MANGYAHACSLSNAKQVSRLAFHSALRLRKQRVVSYPHRGIKSHVHAAAFYDFKPFPLSINTVGATLCGRPFMFRNIKREKNIAFGYPKAEALAQFVHSALFFSSPAAAHACSRKRCSKIILLHLLRLYIKSGDIYLFSKRL